MIIEFSPRRDDRRLESLSKAGDVLTVNGEEFDFSGVTEGCTLPQEAIGSEWFAGPVERIDGVLRVKLLLPHGPNAPESTRFPEPVTVTEDGAIPIPEW